MKRFWIFLLAAALTLSLFGCGQSAAGPAASAPAASTPAESLPAGSRPPAAQPLTLPLRLGALRGPTAMGMVRLMQNSETGEAAGQYEFQVAGTADELVPLLVQSELDAAALPANLAAAITDRADLQVAAINTLGVLYVVSTDGELESLADLRGRTLLSTGKGTTPEYVLGYLLEQNGIGPDELTIEYKSEAAEVLAALEAGQTDAAVLPQPYVTTALNQLNGLRVALDLNEEWARVSPDSALVTGVLVVRRQFARQYPEAVRQLLAEYGQSIAWVNENTAEAARLVANYGIVPNAAIAEQALPACSITWITGKELREKLGGYLAALYAQDPAAVGGSLPGDDFYYVE